VTDLFDVVLWIASIALFKNPPQRICSKLQAGLSNAKILHKYGLRINRAIEKFL